MVVFGLSKSNSHTWQQNSSSPNKLFERPLAKLVDGRAIGQLAELLAKQQEEQIRQLDGSAGLRLSGSSLATPLAGSLSTWAKLSKENNPTKRKRTAARLRRFTLDPSNQQQQQQQADQWARAGSQCNGIALLSERLPNQCEWQNLQVPHEQQVAGQQVCSSSNSQEAAECRRRLMLASLPEPIRCLLRQLYLRGPSTVGIFRKSPNARHCKELRKALEQLQASSTLLGATAAAAAAAAAAETTATSGGQSSSRRRELELGLLQDQQAEKTKTAAAAKSRRRTGKRNEEDDEVEAQAEAEGKEGSQEAATSGCQQLVEQFQVNVIASVFKVSLVRARLNRVFCLACCCCCSGEKLLACRAGGACILRVGRDERARAAAAAAEVHSRPTT